jgi:hypothetical protein
MRPCPCQTSPLRGSARTPATAEAAATAGEQRYDLRLRVPHPPLEVPVRGGDGDLVVAEGPLVDAEARAAAGVHDDGARLMKSET